MIVTTPTSAGALLLDPERGRTRLRILAGRAVLRSETETFEHLRLESGARHTRPDRRDAESVWYVLRGPLTVDQLPSGQHHLADAGDLVLVPLGSGVELTAGPLGAELIGLTLHAAVPTPPSRRSRTRTPVRAADRP